MILRELGRLLPALLAIVAWCAVVILWAGCRGGEWGMP